MATTNFTTNLALALPTTGDLSGTWGSAVNTGISELVDQALGYQAFTATGGSDTLTIPDAASGVARSIYIQLNGTGGGTVNVPATKTKMYFVFNNTASAITFKVTSQTGVSIPAAAKIALVSNGTDVIPAVNYFSTAISTPNNTGSMIPFYWSGPVNSPAPYTAFPNASTSHGAIAHSHSDQKMYYAHGGTWYQFLDDGTDVTVAQGGTGLSTLTANNVIIGNGTSTPLFVAPSSSGNVLTSNGTTWTSSVPAAGGITYTTVKTANYTAVNNDGVQTNTTAGAFTVTLPATPSNGNQVIVVDSFNIWGTNNLTIGRNGSTIEGVAQDLVCDITGVSVQCVYNGTTWDIFAQVGGAGGSVVSGPASSTDNAIARFDGTTGKIIQNSTGATLSDTGAAIFTGALDVLGDSTAGSNLKLYEDTDNGTNFVSLKAPNTIAADVTFTLPSADGTNAQVLQTNGSGVLSFATVSASQWTTSSSDIYYNSGNVGIGTSTAPTARLSATGTTTGFGTALINIRAMQNDGTTLGTPIVLAGHRYLGSQDNNSGVIDVPSSTGRMALSVNSTVMAAYNTTQMGIGANSFGELSHRLAVIALNDLGIEVNCGSATATPMTFRSGGTNRGTITTTSGGTAYNTTSDYRLKENIQTMQNALATVSALKPVTYKWKADNSNGQGFIAHELAEVCPQAVTGQKDAVDANGNPQYQGIDTSFLVATLTSAIQEQQALITTLAERITALEGV